MRILLVWFLSACLVSPYALASDETDDPIELLLQEALFDIEQSDTFDDKLTALMSLETHLKNLDEQDRGSQHYNYHQLMAVLEVAKLNTLSPISCDDALRRIHLGWDPQRAIPRLSGMVEIVYDIVLHLCMFDSGSEC
jgi:hypothetical protein